MSFSAEFFGVPLSTSSLNGFLKWDLNEMKVWDFRELITNSEKLIIKNFRI